MVQLQEGPVRQAAQALRTQVGRAIAALPLGKQPDAALLGDWLQALPLPGPGAIIDEIGFALSLSADLQRLTLRAAAPTPVLGGRTGRFLREAGAGEEEQATYEAACDTLDPEQLGPWLEVGQQGVDGGWHIPGPLSLVAARTYAPDSGACQQLADWAMRHQVETCLALKRSVSEGTPYTELVLPLPGREPRHQLTSALLAFEVMGVAMPPEPVRRAVLRAGRGRMALSAWLLPDGVAKVGLLVAAPSAELVRAVCEAAGTWPEGALRAFEAALGVAAPAWIECQRLPDGIAAEIHYEISPFADPPD